MNKLSFIIYIFSNTSNIKENYLIIWVYCSQSHDRNWFFSKLAYYNMKMIKWFSADPTILQKIQYLHFTMSQRNAARTHEFYESRDFYTTLKKKSLIPKRKKEKIRNNTSVLHTDRHYLFPPLPPGIPLGVEWISIGVCRNRKVWSAGVEFRDEILTQLNAADKAAPDIGTPRPCNSITLTGERQRVVGRSSSRSQSPHFRGSGPLPGWVAKARFPGGYETKQVPRNRRNTEVWPLEILDITFR